MRYCDETSTPDFLALAEFRYQIRRFLKMSEDAVGNEGLEPQQYQFMLALKGQTIRRGTVSIGDLAERLLLKHHSVVGLVDRLESKDMVRRHRDDADQRRVLVQLTPSGEQTLSELAALHQAELHQLAPQLIDALQGVIGSANSVEVSD